MSAKEFPDYDFDIIKMRGWWLKKPSFEEADEYLAKMQARNRNRFDDGGIEYDFEKWASRIESNLGSAAREKLIASVPPEARTLSIWWTVVRNLYDEALVFERSSLATMNEDGRFPLVDAKGARRRDGPRIRWMKTTTGLAYLFQQLEIDRVIKGKEIWAAVASVFTDSESNPITRKQLSDLLSKKKKGKLDPEGPPRGAVEIDKALDSLRKWLEEN